MEIPPNALTAGQSELIKLKLITDLTRYVPLKDGEISPAFAIQCLPDGLQVDVPITVTIPHCAKLSSPANVTPVLYTGKGEMGKFHIKSHPLRTFLLR